MSDALGHRQVGSSELRACRVVLGTGLFGTAISPAEASRILSAYAAHGGNVIDTANVYGRAAPGHLPAAETTVGQWLVSTGARDHMILATKGGCPHPWLMQVPRTTPGELRRDLEDSLGNLQTDRIDLYWLHHDNPSVPVEDLLGACEDFVGEGKIRYYGCSNWTAPRLWQAIDVARRNGTTGFIANQSLMTLAGTNPEARDKQRMVDVDRDLRALHAKTKLPLFAYSAQANGLFSANSWSEFVEHERYRSARALFMNETTWWRFNALRWVSKECGLSPTQLALRYVAEQTAFDAFPIIGPASEQELDESMSAFAQPMPTSWLWRLADEGPQAVDRATYRGGPLATETPDTIKPGEAT